jgi:large subunit ribosomal protein L1
MCVICPPGSKAEADAKKFGATIVGQETVIEAVKAGNISFERCICHPDSLDKVLKSGIARILGPRGLMPSVKLGTVRKDIGNVLQSMVSGSEYRERSGVLRLAVGQLAFTPEQVRTNIQAVVAQVKKDASALSDRTSKEIHEIVSFYSVPHFLSNTDIVQVLSSTSSPGFSLNGQFRSADSLASKELSVM